jgi:hypothetical protein
MRDPRKRAHFPRGRGITYQRHAFSDVFWRYAICFHCLWSGKCRLILYIDHCDQDTSPTGHHLKINALGFPTSLELSFVEIYSLDELRVIPRSFVLRVSSQYISGEAFNHIYCLIGSAHLRFSFMWSVWYNIKYICRAASGLFRSVYVVVRR